MITATIRLDFDGTTIEFDATPWFMEAPGEEIRRLALSGWGGSYAADAIAEWFAMSNAAIDHLLDRSSHLSDAEVENCGFEVYVSQREAVLWMCGLDGVQVENVVPAIEDKSDDA